MGFLRRLFSPKKKTTADSTPNRRHNWSLTRSDKNRLPVPNVAASYGGLDANKHAIAVAAATAAVAEAALAAAHAAAEVVRLTSGRGGARKTAAASPLARGRLAPVSVVEWAAVKIQSSFRGYLGRRALRALKALVKLQALVRGYIVRKQMSNMLRRMQTLVRLQTRARVSRRTISTTNSTLFQNLKGVSNTTYRDGINVSRPKLGSNWLEDNTTWDSPSYTQHRSRQDDEPSTKILQVDTWKPTKESRQIHHGQMHHHHHHHVFDSDSPSGYSSKALNPAPSLSSEEPVRAEKVWSGHNSPQVVTSAPTKRPGSSSGVRRTGPFTPARSECSWSLYNGYSSHPNFMANTESSRAKVRSQSTPRQREFSRPNRALQVSWDGGSLMNQDRRNPSPNFR